MNNAVRLLFNVLAGMGGICQSGYLMSSPGGL